MSNIFSRIASAPKSVFLTEVNKLRTNIAAVCPVGVKLASVTVASADDPITIWMRRGYEGLDEFTYLVTDGMSVQGPDHHKQRIVTEGTFTLEITEVTRFNNGILKLAIHVRPGFNPGTILQEVRSARTTRNELRRISKSASDDERTIEMVIKQLD